MAVNKVFVTEKTISNGIHLFPGQNLYNGSKPLENEFGELNSLEIDLLNVASGIFAADLAIQRDDREFYIRDIEITIDVVNLSSFEQIKDLLENALLTVSKDNWTINFAQKEGIPVSNFEWSNKEGAALLFSGGLDSMCAASDFVKENKNIVLVSHNSHGNKVVDDSQNNVHALLEEYYSKKIKHVHVKVYGRNQGDFDFPTERENTQRTRSFLFLCLAALVSRRSNFNKVLYMAENGQFAIHLPLNQSRIGPFSTHTADPQFAQITKELLKVLLRNPEFDIINPYLYKTKAEVFACLPEELRKKSDVSASCWMISRIPENKHCGYCVPCITRRIALEYNNIQFDEYANDIFNSDLNSLSDTDDKRRNIVDYLEFISKFNELDEAKKAELLFEFPELYNTAFDTEDAILMYGRVSEQSLAVFQKYPNIIKLLG
jgi:7-cyano-7-deazaguanine synthase in queuosine biosynthesis